MIDNPLVPPRHYFYDVGNSFFIFMHNNSSLGWIVAVILAVGFGYYVYQQKTFSPQPAVLKVTQQEVVATTTVPVEAKLVEKPQGEIVIGMMAPLSGEGSAFGQALKNAAMLAVNEINASGGIKGDIFKLVFEDVACDDKEGTRAAQRLINKEGAKFIIGGACSGETFASVSIANALQSVIISPSATSPSLATGKADFVFRFAPSESDQGIVAAQYAIKNLQAKKAAVLIDDSSYAKSLQSVFTETFGATSGSAMRYLFSSSSTADLKKLSRQIKSGKADVVYLVSQSASSGLAMVQFLRDSKLSMPIIASPVLFENRLLASQAKFLEGIIGFDVWYDAKSVEAKRFAQSYQTTFGEELASPFFQSNAYNEVYLAKDLIERVGNDGEKLQNALLNLRTWNGGTFQGASFDTYGDVQWNVYQAKRVSMGEAKREDRVEIERP